MLIRPTGVVVTLKLVVTISPPVVKVIVREPMVAPGRIQTVAVALVGPVNTGFDRVTPWPLTTSRVLEFQWVNCPVKLTLKQLGLEPVGSRPFAGFMVMLGVLGYTLIEELTTWPPVAK